MEPVQEGENTEFITLEMTREKNSQSSSDSKSNNIIKEYRVWRVMKAYFLRRNGILKPVPVLKRNT